MIRESVFRTYATTIYFTSLGLAWGYVHIPLAMAYRTEITQKYTAQDWLLFGSIHAIPAALFLGTFGFVVDRNRKQYPRD